MMLSVLSNPTRVKKKNKALLQAADAGSSSRPDATSAPLNGKPAAQVRCLSELIDGYPTLIEL